MTKLINAMTGTEMWVDDSRVEEYLKLGHKRPGKTAKAGKAKSSQKAAASEDARPQEAAVPENKAGE